MVNVKKMDEALFASLHKELTVQGELIRAREEEKQGLLDEFDAEAKRFFFGKISEKSLASSVKKTNVELQRLDSAIRNAIAKLRATAAHAVRLAESQRPVHYRATLSGIVGGATNKKATKHKKKKR